MGTREYLAVLNYEQLQFARRVCDELIAAKAAEKRVGVWVVSDDCVNLKFFQEDEVLAAAEFVLSRTREIVALPPRRSPAFTELSLHYERMREAEWRELFPNNERGGV